MQQKAKDFGSLLDENKFKASSGWLHRFKAWHAIVLKMIGRESTLVGVPEAVAWVGKELPGIATGYKPVNIYSTDQTRLFNQMLPNRTLALKGDRCHGGKQCKVQVTILLCAHMDASDKRMPFIIVKKQEAAMLQKC